MSAENQDGVNRSPQLGGSPVRNFVLAEGMVHLVSPLQGEHTLCGDAFDLASDEAGYEWTPTNSKTVTCTNCALIIRTCRGVRINFPNGQSAGTAD